MGPAFALASNCFTESTQGMAIQWFPGHMHLTRKAIAERIKDIDVVIELLDARLPGSSSNPLLAEMTRGKPALKVLTKQDLADPERTALWLAHYQAQPGTQALALDASMAGPAKPLIAACRSLVTELSMRLQCDRVGIGVVRKGRAEVVFIRPCPC